MNEDINEKIQRLAKQMKREAQQAWHTIAAKKEKKAADTSSEKTSTEAKPSSTEEKVFPKGNIQTSPSAAPSTEEKVACYPFLADTSTEVRSLSIEEKVFPEGIAKTSLSAAPSTEGKMAPSSTIEVRSRQVPTRQRRAPVKPFAATIVKNWYNSDLKIKNEEIYNRLNGCFRAIQSNDRRTSNCWLTQLEQVILQQHAQIQELLEQQAKTESLLKNLCQYSTTTRSNALNKREDELFSGTSEDQKKLKKIFSSLDIGDLVSFRIPDFLNLLKLHKIQNERVKKLDAEMTVQHMITLNQQNLLEDNQLVDFFKNLEATDIFSYFKKKN